MYLFFDTETTGVPKNYNAPASDARNWPRMVQLAWMLYDEKGHKLDQRNDIIKPEGFVISDYVAKIHGITQERALKEGRELRDSLSDLTDTIYKSEVLVAHNMKFDEKIVGAEFIRSNMKNIVEEKKRLCTMQASIELCSLPRSGGGLKFPKLQELYYKLFNRHFSDAHNACADVYATAQCFCELRKRKLI